MITAFQNFKLREWCGVTTCGFNEHCAVIEKTLTEQRVRLVYDVAIKKIMQILLIKST
jgi:hypothetical protein